MEKAQIAEFLAAIGAGSAITAYITAVVNRRRNNAEAGKFDAESDSLRAELEISINKAALDLVESLRTEVANLREENATLKEKIEMLEQHVGVCQHELGIDPSR